MFANAILLHKLVIWPLPVEQTGYTQQKNSKPIHYQFRLRWADTEVSQFRHCKELPRCMSDA